MASGVDHDNATKVWCVPFGLILGILMGIQCGFIGCIAFTIGGLWLSPDLDTRSKALVRWGLLKGIWWPYRKLIPHRSLFSHGPLLGTALRISYLTSWIAFCLVILHPLGLPTPIEIGQTVFEKIKIYPEVTLAIILGLEGSVWLHLIKDGDPLPREWQRWWNQ